MFTEVHSEPSQTSTMKLSCENSQQLVTINYFCKNAPLERYFTRFYIRL